MERRLAAILAADVVGYSRLMAEDEAGTLLALKTLRKDLIDPLIAANKGRLVKLMGDGALVEFSSALDAVTCACELQRGMHERNGEGPEDGQITFRIGINLGDVIIEEDDLYGDGVNIAARLEALAEPGGILISGKVYGEIRKKLPFTFEDLGKQAVKNIPESVRMYRWIEDSLEQSPQKPPPQKELELPDKPSIAVLPFDNMSGDPDQEFFADGITEDLITALSKIRWFFVISRNSTFTYKGQAVEVTQVARELGVRYVIEGSVRKAGNRVRITAQLIDATTGRHVWAERYDRDLADIFELQDEMTHTLVGAIEPELSAAERERTVRKPPDSLDAWETYQRGLWHLWNFTKDDHIKAQGFFQRTHELDPNFATAYAFESYTHYLHMMLGFSESPSESLQTALTAAKKALALDDKDGMAYFALGRVYMMYADHDASIAELETSIKLNPSFGLAHHGLGSVLLLSGRLEEAAEELDIAIRLSPRDPVLWGTYSFHSLNSTLMHDFDRAEYWARRAMHEPRSAGGGYWGPAVLASALGNLGRIDEAQEVLSEALKRKPDLSLAYISATFPTKQPGGLMPYLEGLSKAGLK